MFIYIIFIIVAIVLCIVGIISRKKIIGNCTLPIQAVITGYHVGPFNRGNRTRYPVFNYVYQDKPYQVIGKTSRFMEDIGKKETIYIDPENPTKHYRNRDLFVPYFLMFWAIFVFMLIGIEVLFPGFF